MRHLSALLGLALPLFSAAAPTMRPRQIAPNDLFILQFAFVLEQLETQFYAQGIAKFNAQDFANAGFSSADVVAQQLQTIQLDEAAHTSILHQTIRDAGALPLTTCLFNFDAALTDVNTMAAVARVVEMVGVGAYLGAAALITDPNLLTAAGSILTIEARHQTVLNLLSGVGTAIPQAFDIALSPPQVLALAGPFISGCDLGIQGNLPLTITNQGVVGVGTLLTFDLSRFAALPGFNPNLLHCQMLVGGAATAISLPLAACVVPQINGPVAIFLTTDPTPLAGNPALQVAQSILAGPAIAFVDTQPQTLGQLARGGALVQSSQIVSNQQASALQSSAANFGAQVPAAVVAPPVVSAPIASAPFASAPVASAPIGLAAPPIVPVSGVNNAAAVASLQVPGGPNFFTGPSSDGATNVLGWSNVPAGIIAPA